MENFGECMLGLFDPFSGCGEILHLSLDYIMDEVTPLAPSHLVPGGASTTR